MLANRSDQKQGTGDNYDLPAVTLRDSPIDSFSRTLTDLGREILRSGIRSHRLRIGSNVDGRLCRIKGTTKWQQRLEQLAPVLILLAPRPPAGYL